MTDPKLIKRIVRILTTELKKERAGKDIVGRMGRAGLRPWQHDLVRRVERELEADIKRIGPAWYLLRKCPQHGEARDRVYLYERTKVK